jgi:hypothetical protein
MITENVHFSSTQKIVQTCCLKIDQLSQKSKETWISPKTICQCTSKDLLWILFFIDCHPFNMIKIANSYLNKGWCQNKKKAKKQ